jgi:very-short-patch-repair endonuclease
MRLTLTQRERSRRLRSTMTDSERKLWSVLRQRQLQGLRFRRQFPIGRFIVDFVCLEAKLIIEVDGGQHDVQRTYDAARDRCLADHGFCVLRVWNNDAMTNPDGIALAILEAVSHPHPVLPPSRGKGPPNARS